MKGDSIYIVAKKLYPNNKEAQEAFYDGYTKCDRKWHNGPRDVSVGTEELDPEFTKKVNNWFADECPHWGCILTNNLWQYYLAKYFYELGQKESKEK